MAIQRQSSSSGDSQSQDSKDLARRVAKRVWELWKRDMQLQRERSGKTRRSK